MIMLRAALKQSMFNVRFSLMLWVNLQLLA